MGTSQEGGLGACERPGFNRVVMYTDYLATFTGEGFKQEHISCTLGEQLQSENYNLQG